MIISKKQIMQLITVAHAHSANMRLVGEYRASEEILELLEQIQEQQSTKLQEIKD